MKPPQFILTEEEYFDSGTHEDVESNIEIKSTNPVVYKTIRDLFNYLSIDFSNWKLQEGHIFDDYFEISYCLKSNNGIYFMISGEIDDDKIIHTDFEISREVSDFSESIINITLEEDQ